MGSIHLLETGFSLTARKYSGGSAYELGQVVDLINLGSCKREFAPLGSPVSSSNDDARSTDAHAGPIPIEGGTIRLCNFVLGKSIKSCQAIKTIPASFVGDK